MLSLFFTSVSLIIISPTAEPPSWHCLVEGLSDSCKLNMSDIRLATNLQMHLACQFSCTQGFPVSVPGSLTWKFPIPSGPEDGVTNCVFVAMWVHQCFDLNVFPYSVVAKTSQRIHYLWTCFHTIRPTHEEIVSARRRKGNASWKSSRCWGNSSMSLICIFFCVCVCACTCVHIHVEARGKPQVPFLLCHTTY